MSWRLNKLIRKEISRKTDRESYYRIAYAFLWIPGVYKEGIGLVGGD